MLGISYLQKPTKSLPPLKMKPTTKPSRKYINPASLATSGIYTQADLDKLRDHIIIPAEKQNVLNSLSPEILGHSNVNDKVSLVDLLDSLFRGIANSKYNHTPICST